MNAEHVSAAYRMLSDARARYASRVLIRPAGDGIEAAFRLERGWVVYKAWSKQEAEAIWQSCYTISGLSQNNGNSYEESEIRLRIRGEWNNFLFDLRKGEDGQTLMVVLKPDYPCIPFQKIDTLLDTHKSAIAGLFSERQPTGMILVNAFDERQRYRMIYGILAALAKNRMDIVSIEAHHYFKSKTIRQVRLGMEEEKPPLRDVIHNAEVISIPNPMLWGFYDMFRLSGNRLIVIGIDFANSLLALRAVLEEVKLRSIIADRLRALWTGRRIDLICKACGGKVDSRRGDTFAQVCKECDGYGRVRGTDLFEVVVPDVSFREKIASDNWMEGLREELDRLKVGSSILAQLTEGAERGEFFSQRYEETA